MTAVAISTPAAEVIRLLTHPPHAAWVDPNPSRSKVTALEHALQAATRAARSKQDREFVVACLLHDVARPLSDVHHGEVIAEILKGRVRDSLYFSLRHYGAFQADMFHGTDFAKRFDDTPWYPEAERLAAIDAASFDPEYPSEPLERFVPLVVKVLSS